MESLKMMQFMIIFVCCKIYWFNTIYKFTLIFFNYETSIFK